MRISSTDDTVQHRCAFAGHPFSKRLYVGTLLILVLIIEMLDSWILRFHHALDRCSMPLGMEDRRILAGHLRASSSYNYNHGPDRARLNIYASHGRTGAWVARHRNTRQFLQIDLRQISLIKGIATQGRREAHQWVKSYTISYSRMGLRFRMYKAYGRVKVKTAWIQHLSKQNSQATVHV